MFHAVAKSELRWDRPAFTSMLRTGLPPRHRRGSHCNTRSNLRSASPASACIAAGPPVLRILPASADYGIWFKRTDLDGDALVPARWDAVVPSQLCTLVANAAGTSVSTIEHVMAALAGCGIHNALIEIDGPEVPILDGSAVPFVEGILARGRRELGVPVRAFRILRPGRGARGRRLRPARPARTCWRSTSASTSPTAPSAARPRR